MTVASRPQGESDVIRATERERLRALVEGNMEVARPLHADDFQLINPFGGSLSKEQYLGAVASGEIDYLVWEPDSIDVRLYEDVAVIRYQSQLEIVVQGRKVPLQRYWHTDSYEKMGLFWAVWEEDGHRLASAVYAGPRLCEDVRLGPAPSGRIALCIPFADRAEARFVPDPTKL